MAQKYVLDTHACVFALTAPGRLGRRARTALRQVEAGRDEAWIPAAVVAELLILRGLGRLRIGLPEIRAAMAANSAYRFLPLDLEQLDEFELLGAIRDPFDRLVVSAARSQHAKLITRDSNLEEIGLVEVVWS